MALDFGQMAFAEINKLRINETTNLIGTIESFNHTLITRKGDAVCYPNSIIGYN